MSEAPNIQPKGKLGWTRIILFASLALNLLVVGLVAGALARHDRTDRVGVERPFMREFGFGPFGQALSQHDRREMEKAIVGRAGDLGRNRDLVRQQLGTFLDALRAEPFDAAAVQQIVAEQQAKLFERQEIGQRLLIDRIQAMDAAERRAFADRLERSLRRIDKKRP